MSLENAFKRLAIQPSTVCRQCRRSLATSARRPQQPQAATTAMLDGFLESSRSQRTTNSPRQQQPSPSTLPSSQSPWAMANSAVAEATQKSRTEQNRVALADLRRSYTRKDLEQQVFRRWKTGDIYSPRDLSGVEASKWKKVSKKPRPRRDVLDQLGVNPLHYYTNFSIMGEYTTEMGKIRSGNETGLRPVNQRKMAKAIRRAKGVGLLMPGTHLHPEVLRLQAVDQLRTPRR